MEPIESSETSAYNNTLTPGTYPKEKKLLSKHGESLKSRTYITCSTFIVFIAIILVLICMHGIYNYIPETNHVSSVQCCSCSVFTVYATCNVILPQTYVLYFHIRSTRWRSLLRHCATSRKVAGSIPDDVNGIFN